MFFDSGFPGVDPVRHPDEQELGAETIWFYGCDPVSNGLVNSASVCGRLYIYTSYMRIMFPIGNVLTMCFVSKVGASGGRT